MDRQIAIDRITETENLTDGLEDDDANWLLDWGIGHVDGLVTGIADEDAAGDKLNQLMAVMRTLNQIASNRAAKPPDALAADIRTFLERYQQAFGAPKAVTPTPTAAAAPMHTSAHDAKTPQTANQTPSASTMPPTAPVAGAVAPKAGQSASAPPTATTPTATPPATQAGVNQPNQPNQPPAATSVNPPAPANATSQASQGADQVAQAASKIAGMTPREAMQYLLSLAEAGAPAA